MGKRLTDASKWDDPWFLDLPNEYKLFWLYLLDKCDHAGIYKVNKRLVKFCLNVDISYDDFLAACNNRVQPLSNGEKWFIPKFLDFQYKSLTPSNKIYASIESSLLKEGLNIPHSSPINGVKEKDKDKEKEKEKEKEKVKNNGFARFWEAYPKKKSKGYAEKVWSKLKADEQLQDRILNAIERAKKSADWLKDGGQFIPHPATWLNAKGWEDDFSANYQPKPVGRDYKRENEELAAKMKAWQQEATA